MVRIGRILRDYQDAGSVNGLLALWGFVDDTTFLTKAGHLGVARPALPLAGCPGAAPAHPSHVQGSGRESRHAQVSRPRFACIAMPVSRSVCKACVWC